MRGVLGLEEASEEETYPAEGFRRPRRIASIACRRRRPRSLPTLQRAIAATIHHLRSPLASALANLELVEDPTVGGLTESQRMHLQYAIESLYDLDRSVGELLAFANLRDQPVRLRTRPVEVSELVAAIHRQMAPRAARLGVALRLDPDNCMATVRTDGRFLRYLVTELVENAIRHSGGKGTVDLVLRAGSRGHLELSVLDEGPGLPSGNVNGAGQRPGPVASPTDAGGMGMGLGIVAYLAQVLQIRIQGANQPRGGCAFHLEIPCHPSNAQRKAGNGPMGR